MYCFHDHEGLFAVTDIQKEDFMCRGEGESSEEFRQSLVNELSEDNTTKSVK